jgi:nitrite reductase/ring-hydroxylating ferredoxin subunit
MNIETQREILRRFFELRDAHTTTLAPGVMRQRASVYTDRDRFAAESEALFLGRPLVVGLSADLPGTGECVSTEVAGVPLLLIRGEDAEVSCFLNICRHRGGRVFTGRGRPGRALKCPYHSWAYDLDGELLGQPLARDAFAELDRSQLGLVRVPCAERFGLLFARLRGSAPIDIEAELCGLGVDLADYCFGDWHFFDQRSGVFDANWKLIRDTFLETYHVFSLPRDTLAPDMLSTPFVGEHFGPHSRGVVMRKEVTSLLERPEDEWELRPYASVVYMPREPAGSEERAFWEANVQFTQRVVFEEDFGQQQDIHRSLRTGLMPEVVYGRNEPALIHHHQEVERALAESGFAGAGSPGPAPRIATA